jgi:hypothetical protein
VLNRRHRGQPGHDDRGGVSAHVDRVVAVGAVDDEAVGLAVTAGATEGACEVDVDDGDVGSAQVVDGDEVGAADFTLMERQDATV